MTQRPRSYAEAIAQRQGKSARTVTSPAHYTRLAPEPIDVIERWGLGFHLGNAVKYIARHDAKGGLDDLRKARWYLDRFIARLEDEGESG